LQSRKHGRRDRGRARRGGNGRDMDRREKSPKNTHLRRREGREGGGRDGSPTRNRQNRGGGREGGIALSKACAAAPTAKNAR